MDSRSSPDYPFVGRFEYYIKFLHGCGFPRSPKILIFFENHLEQYIVQLVELGCDCELVQALVEFWSSSVGLGRAQSVLMELIIFISKVISNDYSK